MEGAPPFPPNIMGDIASYTRMIRVSHCTHNLGYLGMTPGEMAIWCQQPPDKIPPDLDTITWRMKLWSVDEPGSKGLIRSVYASLRQSVEDRRDYRRAEVLHKLDCIYAQAMATGDLRAALWTLREQSRICGLYRPEQVRHTIEDMSPEELVEVLAQNIVSLMDFCSRGQIQLPESVRGMLVSSTDDEPLDLDDFAVPDDL